MATLAESRDPIQIPQLPSGSVKEFIPYMSKNPDKSMEEILEPYKAFEGELRKVYAQQPTHDAVKDGAVNLVPVFDGHEQELKIRARSLVTESEGESSKYIMELKDEDRKPSGSPAVVSSFKDFQRNFNLFSESSLTEVDWRNVVAAGSAVTTSLLPVPEKWAGSKKSLREYYHQHLAPASDVDLFLYGLNEEQALEKIKQIERSIKDSILHEVTTIRSKNAITIVSQYPTRHVQIVLRLYDSISQIITGFDVDCACAAYDGKQVYAAPRALAAFVTQCNTIDLTRRSPSYENRLSKYSHRGFEVHWPLLDRNRIDPTIFERTFGRIQGLARLLILEKLPKIADRDSYMDQRRAERGRPALNRGYRNTYGIGGNVKDQEEDEVAEWVDESEVASYHTMTVPYGEKYHASKINRLLYAKDLLLNAEWNLPKDREVYLHRHPCFFGTAEEVIQDCCGYCPIPKTDEEIEVAEEESKTYVSGELKFVMDDPGRQEIGSFNPITDDEWTTMAYVGDTARLCQAIVDEDLEHVQDWCCQEDVDVNRRDYTGRTPLQLAAMASTAEIVQCLIDNGARMVARLVDGRTALHIAAGRGNAQMVKALMNRSLENEEDEEEMKEARRDARRAEHAAEGESTDSDNKDGDDEGDDANSEASEITLESEDSDSMTMGSFVKIDKDKKDEEVLEDDSMEDPDVYDIDVIAWDYGLSPLHLAILNGHLEIIDLLVSEYGADVLLPVKLVDPGTSNARAAIMTIVLAMFLPTEKAKKVVKKLLELGATSAQGDMQQNSAFHYVVSQDNSDILDVLLSNDRPAALSVLNNMGFMDHWGNNTVSPLTTAVQNRNKDLVEKLLKLGANPSVSFEVWIKAYLAKNDWAKTQSSESNMNSFRHSVSQPIITAADMEMGETVMDLLRHGADPATLQQSSWHLVQNPSRSHYDTGKSLLDIIQIKLEALRNYREPDNSPKKPETLKSEEHYTSGLTDGTYRHWSATSDFQEMKRSNQRQWLEYQDSLSTKDENGVSEKKAAIAKLIQELEVTEKSLLDVGAKPFYEMFPEIPKLQNNHYPSQHFGRKSEPYDTKFTIRVPDLTDVKKEGYFKLFEAAWSNDLETIKAITLAPWARGKDEISNPPLQIAVQDGNGFSPFSIAVKRGHRELARKIVEICVTQYHEDDNKTHRERWNLRTDDSDDEDNINELPPIFSELISDKFTVDNLGEVSNVVKSHVLPLTMIEWNCPFERFADNYTGLGSRGNLLADAVDSDDMDLLKFMLDLGAEQQALRAEEPEDRKAYTIGTDVFQRAIQRGQTSMLAEMIKATGVGIPLNDLIQKSGVEINDKPKYYQGLSVGGKKRADWAQAPGGNVAVAENKIPPLLLAAHAGSIESVEWFMSDAPMRRYKEFAEQNEKDKRIKSLTESDKGFGKTIGKWLDTKSELTLHCAILWAPCAELKDTYLALIKHLVSVMPETLEQKSSDGWTPLHLAVCQYQEEVVSYLISVGANQRSRDRIGRNMIHNMVKPPVYFPIEKVKETLPKLLELFDKAAVKEMLLERCNETPGALTPLAYWMARAGTGWSKDPYFIPILAKHSSSEDLEMVNGEGDLPLHVAVKQGWSTMTSYLLSLNPSLLYRENSTGRTPLEMSRDKWIASCAENPPSISVRNPHAHYTLIQRSASDFVKKDVDRLGDSAKRTWEICAKADEEASDGMRKRRLVSLLEANEVAKRVAGSKSRSGGRQTVINGGLVVTEGSWDIVSSWNQR
ncbi:Uncharacterized protein LHYA1_G001351 [Lachnellula hyalina]|uniref:Ankyrin repeat protein n=1 Tax=Lachnellula hyalina TaxID=1316788 RepID=A0A8H8R9M9_9HELO|nr:Uncharacterized protein LHYA1_G001351 [Lachnellula hyalina]TVY29345.1 Uncharacterized protein LHYA1_G001351 [Lachnellula hyalina]